MTPALRAWTFIAALLATLIVPVALVTTPAAAQLPTPVLEDGAAGDGTATTIPHRT